MLSIPGAFLFFMFLKAHETETSANNGNMKGVYDITKSKLLSNERPKQMVSLFPWSKDGWCSLVVDVTCPWTFPNFLPIRCCFRFHVHWTCSLDPFWSVSW
jgi:hypothetical protein